MKQRSSLVRLYNYKLAKICEPCEESALVFIVKKGYKYLRIIESRDNPISTETLNRIEKEILERTEKLCRIKLNGINIVKAIDEYTLSFVK